MDKVHIVIWNGNNHGSTIDGVYKDIEDANRKAIYLNNKRCKFFVWLSELIDGKEYKYEVKTFDVE